MTLTLDAQIAAQVMARLAAPVMGAYLAEGGTNKLAHLPGLLDAQWVAGLPLPIDEQRQPGQPVTLADDWAMERLTIPAEADAAYARRTRTRILSAISHRSNGWYALVAAHLAEMLDWQVITSLFESRTIDEHFGAYDDDRWGLIMQVRGAKTWRLWTDSRSSGTPMEITTSAGDLLMLPQGMAHEVSTPGPPDHPDRSGYSVHLAYAVLTHQLPPPTPGTAGTETTKDRSDTTHA